MENKEKITTIWLSNQAHKLFESFLEREINRVELNKLMKRLNECSEII